MTTQIVGTKDHTMDRVAAATNTETQVARLRLESGWRSARISSCRSIGMFCGGNLYREHCRQQTP
ncbi:MAG: hypothetical protein EOP89_09125 [Lysobacteraceae bacterium]|nr:MAG: hypothetical protein EOP89_09125 [Xanthomonadaceae bacterium]